MKKIFSVEIVRRIPSGDQSRLVQLSSDLLMVIIEILKRQMEDAVLGLDEESLKEPLLQRVFQYKKGILSFMSCCNEIYFKTRSLFNSSALKYLEAIDGCYKDDLYRHVSGYTDQSAFVLFVSLDSTTNQAQGTCFTEREINNHRFPVKDDENVDSFPIDRFDIQPIFQTKSLFKLTGICLRLYSSQNNNRYPNFCRKIECQMSLGWPLGDEFYNPLFEKEETVYTTFLSLTPIIHDIDSCFDIMIVPEFDNDDNHNNNDDDNDDDNLNEIVYFMRGLERISKQPFLRGINEKCYPQTLQPVYMMSCGIGELDDANVDEDTCCHGVVTRMVERVCIGLNEDEKKEISKIISSRCLHPPGMTNDVLMSSILLEFNERKHKLESSSCVNCNM